jgi:hypothetical protein
MKTTKKPRKFICGTYRSYQCYCMNNKISMKEVPWLSRAQQLQGLHGDMEVVFLQGHRQLDEIFQIYELLRKIAATGAEMTYKYEPKY